MLLCKRVLHESVLHENACVVPTMQRSLCCLSLWGGDSCCHSLRLMHLLGQHVSDALPQCV